MNPQYHIILPPSLPSPPPNPPTPHQSLGNYPANSTSNFKKKSKIKKNRNGSQFPFPPHQNSKKKTGFYPIISHIFFVFCSLISRILKSHPPPFLFPSPSYPSPISHLPPQKKSTTVPNTHSTPTASETPLPFPLPFPSTSNPAPIGSQTPMSMSMSMSMAKELRGGDCFVNSASK